MIKRFKKYRYALMFLILPIVILILRFEDFRGSYFLNTINFAKTKGNIVESRIVIGSKPRYRFDILYSYQVDGHKYSSARVGFGFKGSRDKSSVELVIDRYKKGSVVRVYYDPSNPEFSVLEPERNSRKDFNILLLTCFLGALFAVIAIRRGTAM